MRHINWSWQPRERTITFNFKTGAEKTFHNIDNPIPLIYILDSFYDSEFSEIETECLLQLIKMARIDIKNKNKLRIIK